MIVDRSIDNGNAFDWGKVSKDYGEYRDIYPEEFYTKLVSLDVCTEGQTVLDLGTGTGVLPRNMHKYGASFVGVDISEKQIETARELSAGKDIEYIVSSVEKMDFAEDTFDVITACQSFMYFDKGTFLPKASKILKPDGKLAILFLAWLPGESHIAWESEQLVLKYNPLWSGDGMTRELPCDFEWAEEYFEVEENFGFDVNLQFTRESWNGRMKACRGTGASLAEDQLFSFEQEHIEMLEKSAPDSFEIPHYATIQVLRSKK